MDNSTDNSIYQPKETSQEYNRPQQNQPQQETTGTIRKVFNTSSWFVFFAFLPLTVLILLSQNTIPGDLFYPIKRSMENVVLAAAAVSPTTRAAFRTDLTTRRFDEAEKLLLTSSDTQGLKDFVTEIGAAQKEVSAISDPVKKQELQQKIQTSVIEYEKRLDAVKTQLVTRENAIAVVVPTSAPTKIPESQPSTSPQTISSQIEPTAIPLPTNTLVPLPTSSPKPATPSKPPAPTATPIPPALTSIPTSTPTPTPTRTPQPAGGEGTIGTVDEVRDFLHCLQITQPPHKECVSPEIKSANFNSEDKSEGRKEEKPKQDEKPEGRKQEKEKNDKSVGNN